MVARVRTESGMLVVVFEREGEEPIRVEVANGEKALIQALRILLTHHELMAFDNLTVLEAD
jgi:hypothetical protein